MRSGKGPVAAIDCGTNSIRLLIAEADEAGGLVEIDRRLEIVRLGQGVDATGELHPEALARTFAAVDAYAEVIEGAGVPTDAVHFVATSAARDVSNRDTFFAGISQRLGVLPDVISGVREAQLSFTGALSGLPPAETGRPSHPADLLLVMDIGGGSTELIVGTATGQIWRAVSLDVGSVRLTERFLPNSPPASGDLDRAARHVDELLSGVDFGGVNRWIGVAGTVTTLAAVSLGLPAYDRDRVHGAVVGVAELIGLFERLSSLDVTEIRAIPSMHPQRADVITAGSLIAARVAAAISPAKLVVSESDILDGIALELLTRRGEAGSGASPDS